MTSENKMKTKKILGVVGNVLIWAFVAFSVFVTVLVFAAQGSDDGIPTLFGKSWLTIESPSMTPTYKVGDLVFMEKLSDEEKKTLEKDMIITYYAPIDINNDGTIGDINTHRIYEHNKEKGIITTIGDNNEGVVDTYTIGYNDIIGICTEDGKIGGVGNVIRFLRSSVGFFICIVLPLVLFFLYELYVFISIIVTERAKKVPVSKETEEEIKRRAIEEYLKSQSQDMAKENNEKNDPEEKKD